MLETFYEQIREFGVQIESNHINSQEKSYTIETYIVLGTEIDVYINNGKPKTIIVSE